MASPPPKKKKLTTRYKAVARLPVVNLGNLSGLHSLEIDVTRHSQSLGTFYISRAGIEWRAFKKRKRGRQTPGYKSWLELTEFFSN
jgi:hypothetical protein